MATLRVASERCKTCIFDKKNRPISTERFKDLQEQWGEYGHQICHQFGTGCGDDDETGEHELDGEDVVCRGFYDSSHWTPKSKEIMEQIGLIEFVPLPSAEESRA